MKKCEHKEWMQHGQYIHMNWTCTDCGLIMTAAEYEIYNKLVKIEKIVDDLKPFANHVGGPL